MSRLAPLILALIATVYGSYAVAANPLPLEQAFKSSVSLRDPNTITLKWKIADGYNLYRDRLQFKLENPQHLTLGVINLPTGQPLAKADSVTAQEHVYRNSQHIDIPILGLSPGDTVLHISYQGCADSGFCYPPSRKALLITVAANLDVTAVTFLTAPQAHLNQAESVLQNYAPGWVMLSFLGFGLLLAFTPCVLPMVPILSALIVGQAAALQTRQAFFLSLAYVLSMASTYALIGIGIALLGKNFQTALQTPLLISLSALLFCVLAASLFDWIELKLPKQLHTWVNRRAQQQTGGTYCSVIAMGVLSTLILSPCVTAPLLGALSFIARTGDMLIGALALFSLGIGIGAPLLVITILGQRFLPRSGPWMVFIKQGFGVAMLGIAILLLERLLPETLTLLLWSSLFIITAVAMGVFTQRPTSNVQKVNKTLSILLLVAGLVGLLKLPALTAFFTAKPSATTSSATLHHQRTSDLATLQQWLKMNNGKPSLVMFHADWCRSCKLMQQRMSNSTTLRQRLKDWNFIQVNVTARNSASRDLETYFNIIAPPVFLFFDAEGIEHVRFRLTGEVSMQALLDHLRQVALAARSH
jgi:thioredoxin:protein disulfide reductase